MRIRARIIIESLVLLRRQKHRKVLVTPVECDLVENLVVTKLAVERNVVQNHKHRARVVLLASRVARYDFLLQLVNCINLLGTVLRIDIGNRNVLGELLNHVLRRRLDEARVESTRIVVQDVFQQNRLALARSAKNVPREPKRHRAPVVLFQVDFYLSIVT